MNKKEFSAQERAYREKFGVNLYDDVKAYANDRKGAVAKRFEEFGIMRYYQPDHQRPGYYWSTEGNPVAQACLRLFLTLVSGLPPEYSLWLAVVKSVTAFVENYRESGLAVPDLPKGELEDWYHSRGLKAPGATGNATSSDVKVLEDYVREYQPDSPESHEWKERVSRWLMARRDEDFAKA
jgi:hypothetical protein